MKQTIGFNFSNLIFIQELENKIFWRKVYQAFSLPNLLLIYYEISSDLFPLFKNIETYRILEILNMQLYITFLLPIPKT